jgi:hypothetical protein
MKQSRRAALRRVLIYGAPGIGSMPYSPPACHLSGGAGSVKIHDHGIRGWGASLLTAHQIEPLQVELQQFSH